MLVLMRRIGEVVRVGDEIAFRVVGVAGKKVRLSFEAPAVVRVRCVQSERRLTRRR